MRTYTLLVCVMALLFVNCVFLYAIHRYQNAEYKSAEIVKKIVAEKDVTLQSPFVLTLIKINGVEKTQELLFSSGLPFTGESHLLIHTIGNYIYDTFDDGLSLCKDYFLSACYHAFIIRDLADHGVGGVARTVEECARAGPYVLTQCSHAAGHGFLVWADYDIPQALTMCDQIHETFAEIPTFNCYDGIFMENIYGVHEGSPSPKRWIKTDDFDYPCNDGRILDTYKEACWANQATLVYVESDQNLEKVIAVCDTAPSVEYQTMCYNNYARQIHPLTYGQYNVGHELCQKASSAYWIDYCEISLMNAAYSVGDRTRLPFEVCRGIGTQGKLQCYKELIGNIKQYASSQAEIKEQCEYIQEENYKDMCRLK